MSSVKRRGHALRGPAEPHLRFPGYRRIGEQRQIPATVFHPGHAAGQSGLVHGQPAGMICLKSKWILGNVVLFHYLRVILYLGLLEPACRCQTCGFPQSHLHIQGKLPPFHTHNSFHTFCHFCIIAFEKLLQGPHSCLRSVMPPNRGQKLSTALVRLSHI